MSKIIDDANKAMKKSIVDSGEEYSIEGNSISFVLTLDKPKPKPKQESTMIPFDLEKALAGDKVVTRSGRNITQIVRLDARTYSILYGIDEHDGEVEDWQTDGTYQDNGCESSLDLLMAPKALSGFVNIYENNHTTWCSTKQIANHQASIFRSKLVICIDLSQHNEGDGI